MFFLNCNVVGFDLIEVGEDEVILSVGKHVSSRMLQLALQATLALFGMFIRELHIYASSLKLA